MKNPRDMDKGELEALLFDIGDIVLDFLSEYDSPINKVHETSPGYSAAYEALHTIWEYTIGEGPEHIGRIEYA